MKKLVTALLLLSSITAFSQCIVNDSLIYEFTRKPKIYTLIKQPTNWVSAADCALKRGGRLVAITSDSEQIAINAALKLTYINTNNTMAPDGGGASYIWTGGTDAITEGNWNWDGDNDSVGTLFYQGQYPTGTAVNNAYLNWGNEPDNYNGVQDALGLAITDWPLGVAGQWNDLNPTNNLYYLVEYDWWMGMDEVKSNIAQIFPNPANEVMHIHLNEAINGTATLLQISGKELLKKVLTSQQTQLIVTDIVPGFYLLQINDKQGNFVFNQKITITH